MKTLTYAAAAALIVCTGNNAYAQNHDHHHNHHNHTEIDPISVMESHMHGEGEWMVSYRFKSMMMDGIRDGTDDLSVTDVLNLPNPNAPPANLRVVPTEMTMDMHMFGMMYGVRDWLTLMAMGMVVNKDMKHLTYNMTGANIGGFTTESNGFGDSSLSGLIRLHKDNTHHLHLNLSLSAPTGSIDEKDRVLAPNGTTPTLRLPYAMQLGTGTWDFLPGMTYTGAHGKWNWGAQYKGAIRLESENDEGYSWGNKHRLQAWSGYRLTNWLQANTRLSYETMQDIDGQDAQITAPVPTANPDNYGGDIAELAVGLNFTPTSERFENHQMGLEVAIPFHQDLNGPQMKRDWTLTAGWKITF